MTWAPTSSRLPSWPRSRSRWRLVRCGLRSWLLPTFTGATARLAEAVFALSTLLLICETLGLLGLFEEMPLASSRASLLGSGRGWLGRATGTPAELRQSVARPACPSPAFLGGYRLQLGIAIAASAVVFTHWAMPTLESLGEGIYGFDSQWYHLPFAARFAETGSVWDFHYTTPVLLSWFYPANSELSAWGGDGDHRAGHPVSGSEPRLAGVGTARGVVSWPAVGSGWVDGARRVCGPRRRGLRRSGRGCEERCDGAGADPLGRRPGCAAAGGGCGGRRWRRGWRSGRG